MASVFTFDPDPAKVSSPWPEPIKTPQLDPWQSDIHGPDSFGGLTIPPIARLEDYAIRYLPSEPQLGSVEYKLHLLLRPRPQFAYSSTGDPNTDPRALTSTSVPRRALGTSSDFPTASPGKADKAGNYTLTSSKSPSAYSRQNRLQHLTTQLKWRLQQSSPYHASNTADLVMANLPNASNGRLRVPEQPGKLVAGIEDSQGAIYEVGVNDDGALIGLTRDEMSESLINLTAMAASLGCAVTIVRVVVVGKCQLAPAALSSSSAPVNGAQPLSMETAKVVLEDLLVVEALVLPNTPTLLNRQSRETPKIIDIGPTGASEIMKRQMQDTEQLRVALTGSTQSGKSSLLGTLLASTLDNGRGSSRLNTLKHRHEIASGITSSVAHELLGYQKYGDKVVNYACNNVESWNDVHGMSEGGRLVLVTDSAGLPRFRRTIVRGLVAWRPHWTLCCIAARSLHNLQTLDSIDSGYDRDGLEMSGGDFVNMDHLELCLKLGLPLVVIITKTDQAESKEALKYLIGKVLKTLKAAGRVPQILRPESANLGGKKTKLFGDDLQSIPPDELHEVRTVLESVQVDPTSFVPILLTSAVSGAGMTKLHALLRQLPIPPELTTKDLEESSCYIAEKSDLKNPVLFDIDDVFVKQTHVQLPRNSPVSADHTFVLSGLVRCWDIKIGEELLLGPFAENACSVDPRPPLDDRRAASYPGTHHEMAMRRAARFGPRRRRSSEDMGISNDRPMLQGKTTSDDGMLDSDWYKVKVVSLRNLRLPVQTIFEGQAATVGVKFHPDNPPRFRPRKGMVLLPGIRSGLDVSACTAFKAVFNADLYFAMEPGDQHTVYVASIRALVKIISVGLFETPGGNGSGFSARKPDDDLPVMVYENSLPANESTDTSTLPDVWEGAKIEVMFQLIHFREYLEVGAKALIMPLQPIEGRPCLDGYVGYINALCY